MYSIHNRDDLEKLKKLQETKSSLKAERLKEKLGKHDFHYDMEEVFEPVTENQKQNQTKQQELSEKQIQALRDSTQTTTQAIENQTRAIEHSSDILNENLQKSIKDANSNQVDSSIVKTVSNLLNTQSQFRLEPVEGNPNLFIINPFTNPQKVSIKGSTMTFQNGNTYYLNDPDLSNFITNTQHDKIKNIAVKYNFLRDMNYDLNYGDKKSNRYNFIKSMLQPQKGSGLNFTGQRPANPVVCVFLPSDPDELVDQLKLLYFEKVGGNDNPMLSEQIIAIADKLLQYQCITTNQHQNMHSTFGLISTFTKKDQFVD